MVSIVFVVLLSAAAVQPLYGYTDPGSGLLLWQMMGAAFVGSIFYLKRFFGKLRIGRKKTGNEDDQ